MNSYGNFFKYLNSETLPSEYANINKKLKKYFEFKNLENFKEYFSHFLVTNPDHGFKTWFQTQSKSLHGLCPTFWFVLYLLFFFFPPERNDFSKKIKETEKFVNLYF